MKVILSQDVISLGIEGDVIEVADGYARNYLIPKRLAAPATIGNLKDLEFRRKAIEKKEAKRIDEAQKHAKKFEGKKIKILVKVAEEGKLYGSVTVSDVTELIKENFKEDIDKRIIVLHDHIKEIGIYPVIIRLHPKVEASFDLEVVPEEEPDAKVKTKEEKEKKAKKSKAKETETEIKEPAATKEETEDKASKTKEKKDNKNKKASK